MVTKDSVLLKRISVKSKRPTGKEALKMWKGIVPKSADISFISNGDEFVIEEDGFFMDEFNGYDVPGIVVETQNGEKPWYLSSMAKSVQKVDSKNKPSGVWEHSSGTVYDASKAYSDLIEFGAALIGKKIRVNTKQVKSIKHNFRKDIDEVKEQVIYITNFINDEGKVVDIDGNPV